LFALSKRSSQGRILVRQKQLRCLVADQYVSWRLRRLCVFLMTETRLSRRVVRLWCLIVGPRNASPCSIMNRCLPLTPDLWYSSGRCVH